MMRQTEEKPNDSADHRTNRPAPGCAKLFRPVPWLKIKPRNHGEDDQHEEHGVDAGAPKYSRCPIAARSTTGARQNRQDAAQEADQHHHQRQT